MFMNEPKIQPSTTIPESPVVPPPTSVPHPAVRLTPAMPAGGLGPHKISGSPNGTKTEQLVYFEEIVTHCLRSEDLMVDALTEILRRKLYKETHLPFREYVQARWGISRSRAYQLAKFARLKIQAAATGQTPTATESAARALGADGQPRPAANNYSLCLGTVKRQLQNRLVKLPPEQQQRFIIDLQIALKEWALQLDSQPAGAVPAPIIPARPLAGIVPPQVGDQRSPTISKPETAPPAAAVSPEKIPVELDQPRVQPPPAAAPPSAPAPAEPMLPAGPAAALPPLHPAGNCGYIPMDYPEAKARGLLKRQYR